MLEIGGGLMEYGESNKHIFSGYFYKIDLSVWEVVKLQKKIGYQLK